MKRIKTKNYCVRLYFDGKALNFKTGTFQSKFLSAYYSFSFRCWHCIWNWKIGDLEIKFLQRQFNLKELVLQFKILNPLKKCDVHFYEQEIRRIISFINDRTDIKTIEQKKNNPPLITFEHQWLWQNYSKLLICCLVCLK